MLAGLVATIVAAFATGIASRPFDVAVSYARDGLYFGYLIQNTLETGWYLDAPRLGFPFPAGMHDFPIGEYTNILLVRFLALFFSDFGAIYNAFYLTTFLLAAAVACWILIRLRATPWLAAAGGIVFALLPYHFLRANHLFLGAYWVVPVYAFLALRGFQGARIVSGGSLAAWAAVLLLAGGAGIYYAFFGCLLLGSAALIEAARRGSLSPLFRALAWITPIVVGVALSLAPHALYWKEHGRNAESAARSGVMSERYALKPIQLFLPTPEHRIPALAKVAERYKAVSSFTNENQSAALGILGATALLISLLVFFVGRPRFRSAFIAGRYNTMALLYAAVGGLGSAIAYTVLPEIRSTNRISVFIGFFSVIVLVTLAQRSIARSLSGSGARAFAIPACATALVAIAVFDQVPAPHYLREDDFKADQAFFSKVEAMLPAGAPVLQLPYVAFPEGRKVNGMDEYSHLRSYLHTKALRFSFAVMKGRPGDTWQCAMHSLPPERVAQAAAAAGFAAVILVTAGYADGGAELAKALAQQAGPPLLVGRGMSLFAVPAALKTGAAPVVAVSRHEGFFGWEQWRPGVFASRATGNASVRLISSADVNDAAVNLLLKSHAAREVMVAHRGVELARVALEPDREIEVRLRLDLRRGVNIVDLKTDVAAAVPVTGDSRPVAFSVAMSRCPER